MSDWQPIETAPNGKTIIDLWHSKEGRIPDCYWDDGDMIIPLGWCKRDGEFELSSVIDTTLITHWMPIPEPPKED